MVFFDDCLILSHICMFCTHLFICSLRFYWILLNGDDDFGANFRSLVLDNNPVPGQAWSLLLRDESP